MPDTDYTNRELDKEFKQIHDAQRHSDKELHVKLDEIICLTRLTNGRVTKLENWKGRIVGGMVVIVGIVIPLIIYSFNLALTNH